MVEWPWLLALTLMSWNLNRYKLLGSTAIKTVPPATESFCNGASRESFGCEQFDVRTPPIRGHTFLRCGFDFVVLCYSF
ncbi:hypothetical protein L596_028387 [Steinernema carpocapsae]|uniref:Secreted protein n=1 Tax=Steinernema carpocapsae TaxID=34508 RepID=A0A4U5LY95_STECR|nr:hypothetical protein L596_028387 [Steinernema carpocapsae]